jgi:hypothetical protein
MDFLNRAGILGANQETDPAKIIAKADAYLQREVRAGRITSAEASYFARLFGLDETLINR